jgi:hypothetical protein
LNLYNKIIKKENSQVAVSIIVDDYTNFLRSLEAFQH